MIVIFLQSLNHGVEGNDSGRCNHTCLTESASQDFATPDRLLDERLGPYDQVPRRAAESFGQADGNRVCPRYHILDRDLQSDGSIEDSSTIQMDWQVVGVCHFANLPVFMTRHRKGGQRSLKSVIKLRKQSRGKIITSSMKVSGRTEP